MDTRDYAGLNKTLLNDSLSLLSSWLPGGKRNGNEYVCAGLEGGKGGSFSVNTSTGAWAEFNGSGLKGGDLISLYAAIHGITQSVAYDKLNPKSYNLNIGSGAVGRPPIDDAEMSWCYRDAKGKPIFWVARYPGKKIRPWSFIDGNWRCESPKKPRPLYGLDLMAKRATDPVLIVEGEKACEAARELVGGTYVCVTWPNGASAVNAADWTPLVGRSKVLIWPDADVPGLLAAETIAKGLVGYVKDVKVLAGIGGDIPDGCSWPVLDAHDGSLPIGWDAADAVREGWSPEQWLAWAKPRARLVEPAIEVVRPGAMGAVGVVAVNVTVAEDAALIPQSVAVICETYGLAVAGNSGMPLTNADNCVRVLDAVPGFTGMVWWDEFYGRLFHAGGEWTDANTIALLVRFQRELGFQRLSDTTLYHALVAYGRLKPRNEPRDWMQELTWDGVKRVEGFFRAAFGAKNNDYTRAVSRNFWLTLVARAVSPGCKVDTMVVLEGRQGAGKGRALQAIGGKWFTEASESVMSKDFYMCLQGKLIIEIGEMDVFGRAERTRIKQILSSCVDRYRSPYGRLAEDSPRRSVFVGTTNESSYLNDPTGARRFWPVKVGNIDLTYIYSNRDQLFAEGMALFSAWKATVTPEMPYGNESLGWWQMPDSTAAEQESRRQHDEWEPVIDEFLIEHKDRGISIREIWIECMKQTLQTLGGREQWRIIHILQALGWSCRVAWRDGITQRLYFPKDETNKSPEINGDPEF